MTEAIAMRASGKRLDCRGSAIGRRRLLKPVWTGKARDSSSNHLGGGARREAKKHSLGDVSPGALKQVSEPAHAVPTVAVAFQDDAVLAIVPGGAVFVA